MTGRKNRNTSLSETEEESKYLVPEAPYQTLHEYNSKQRRKENSGNKSTDNKQLAISKSAAFASEELIYNYKQRNVASKHSLAGSAS